MCNNLNKNICTIDNEVCPFVYWCDKAQAWKPSKYMPTQCKKQVSADVPSGYHKVCFERKGNLYVDMGDTTICVPNPFDTVPPYVKVTKTKTGVYRLRK